MKYIFFLLIISTFLLSKDLKQNFLTDKQNEFIKKNPVIKVSNEENWPPFDYNEDGVPKGYAIDYLKLLSEKIGVKFVFETDTWSNLIKKAKNKQIDVIHPLTKNSNREEFLYFTSPFIYNDLFLVVSNSNFKINTLKDMDFKILAVGKDWNSTKYIRKTYPNIILKEYSTSREMLEAVSFGNADAAVDSYLTINFIKQKYLLNNLKIKNRLNLEKFDFGLRIGVRKDWQIFKDILELGMNKITSDEITQLNNKWLYDKKNILEYTPDELAYLKGKKQINMCIDPNWFPYEKIENGKHIGITSDYFEIFKSKIPIPINLVQTSSWVQTLDYAKNRKCDIISLAVETPSRLEYLNFTDPYLKLPLVVATKLDKPFIDGISSILEYDLAVIKGFFHVELLRNKYPGIKLVEVDSVDDGFDKVINGDVYGFIDTLNVIGSEVQKEYLGNIKIAGKLEEEFIVGIAVRNDDLKLKNIFQKAVKTLNKDDHRQILNKWVSVKYEKNFDYKTILEILIVTGFILFFLIYRQYMLGKQNHLLIDTKNKLQNSVKEFEHLIDSTIEAIFILEKGKFIDSNKEGVELLGFRNKDEMIGLTPYDVIDKRDHKILKEKLKINATKPYEIRAVKRDGTVLPVLIKGHNFVLRDKNVRVTGMVDLSELKEKERLLTENTKMIALGEMLGNIAHQWRQPLSVITTAASGVKVQKDMGLLSDEIFYESMNGIIENANYLSETIDDFKNFINSDKVKNKFNLKEHFQKDLTILNSMLKLYDINVVLNINDDIIINNIENELTQVVINLVSNSKDKFEEGNCRNKYIFIDSKVNNNKVFIKIKDNANGVPEEIIERIFEPYFTTKHKNRGTGLGLYMTSEIITKSMKGTIEVKNVEYVYNNEKCKGAEFTISLDM